MGLADKIKELFSSPDPLGVVSIDGLNKAMGASQRSVPVGMTQELGSTGLKQVGGVVIEEWLPQLQGERGIKVWREMSENDPTVGAVLFAIEMLIRQVDWSVEPASEDPQDVANAEFLESCMHDMDRPWVSFVSDVLTMLAYGWSVHEIVYKLRRGASGDQPSDHDDGRIGWARLPIRGQDTLLQWVFDDHERVEAFIQVHPTTFQRIEIPIGKLIHFRTRERRGPEGYSILRNAFRPWLFKKRLEEIEAIGIERDMAGLPVAHVPAEFLAASATPDQVAMVTAIKRLVRGIKVNEQMGVVFPMDHDHAGNNRFKLELLSSSGGSKRPVDPAIRRYKQDIATTVLADFVLLGHDKVGSFALSSSKTEVFGAAMGAYLDSMANVFNSQAVPRLFGANGIGGPFPRVVHGDIETPDLDSISNFVLRLSNAGAITPDDKLERHLRRAASLPEREM